MRERTRLLSLAAASLLAIASSRAWVPTGATVLPDGQHSINLALAATAPSNRDWDSAAREALNAWNPYLQRVQLVSSSAPGPAAIENGRDDMYFSPTIRGQSFPSGVLAVTDYDTEYGVRVEADITFNSNVAWDIYNGSRPAGYPYDFRRVAVHELGHLLGLDHSEEAAQSGSAIMSRSFSSIERPTVDDQTGARALYDVVTTKPPVILTHPTSKYSATLGVVTTFTTFAGGRGPLSYQWRHAGVPIPGATNAMLKFAITLESIGRYTVDVTGPAGSATSKVAELWLLSSSAPSWAPVETGPAPASYGSTVTVSAQFLSSFSSTTFRWYKDGVLLPDAPNSRYLVLNNVTFSDAGNYTIEATNEKGSATSAPIPVRIVPGVAPRFKSQPGSAHLPPGSSFTTRVEVKADSAAYSLQWQKNGVDLPGQTTTELSFAAFGPADEGQYRVILTSQYGKLASADADIRLLQPAEFTILRHPGAVTEYVGGAVSLSVETSLPGTEYRWFKNGSPLPDASPGITGVRSASLAIDAIGTSDRGLYTVEVSRGGVKRTSYAALLEVLVASPADGSAVISRHPRSTAVKIGASVTLDALVKPEPNLTYFWFKLEGNGKVVGTSSSLTIPAFSKADAGSYRLNVMNSSGFARSEIFELEVADFVYPLIKAFSGDVVLDPERGWYIQVQPGREALNFRWLYNGLPVPDQTKDSLGSIGSGLNSRPPGVYTVEVSDGVTTETHSFTVRAWGTPEILYQPISQTTRAGNDIVLKVGAAGNPEPGRVQWLKDGVVIPGAIDFDLRLNAVRLSDAGSYSAIVTNALGSTTSQAATLTVENPGGRLVNLATRARVGTGGDILIAGFVVEGTSPRKVLVRAVGEELAKFGVTGRLRDPLLKVFDSAGKQVATNDEWDAKDEDFLTLDAAFPKVGAFGLSGGTRDAALLIELPPGNYTAQISDFKETSGVALVEIYEFGNAGSSRMINLSSRAVVGTGADILIPSLVLASQDGTQTPRRLLVRAVGPRLGVFGVEGALVDPIMRIFRGQTLIAENDDWSADVAEAMKLAAAMDKVGAFSLEAGSKDAALLLDLPPGDYTIQVSGVGETTGVALVEVYELKQ